MKISFLDHQLAEKVGRVDDADLIPSILQEEEISRADRPMALQDELKQPRIRCVICREQLIFFKVIKALCSDYYCQDCLVRLFQASLTDETLFPPRCCQKSIPLESVTLAKSMGSDLSALQRRLPYRKVR